MPWSLRLLAGLIVGGCFGTLAATVTGALCSVMLPGHNTGKMSTSSQVATSDSPVTEGAIDPDAVGGSSGVTTPMERDRQLKPASGRDAGQRDFQVGEDWEGRSKSGSGNAFLARFHPASGPLATVISGGVGITVGLVLFVAVWRRLLDSVPAPETSRSVANRPVSPPSP